MVPRKEKLSTALWSAKSEERGWQRVSARYAAAVFVLPILTGFMAVAERPLITL